MTYLRWASEYKDGYCVITTPKNDIDEKMCNAESFVGSFPDDVTCLMRDDYPDDIELGDNLYGSIYPIISEKMKLFLLGKLPEGSVEFLPVSIVNHKGRVELENYYFIHPLILCDCIDLNASEVEWNELAPDTIADCMGLVLREEVIPDDLQLFRLKSWGDIIIIRSDLAEQLERAGFSGLYFPEAAGYDGL
jgi:hypothetical protein